MSTTRPLPAWSRATVGAAALLGLPLAVLAILRLLPAAALDASPPIAWSVPLAAAVVALSGTAALLSCLFRALRGGEAAAFLEAAGAGVLAGTYAIESFAGPSVAPMAPTWSSAVGILLAAVLLLAGAAAGLRRIALDSRAGPALGVLGVFAVTDLALGAVVLAMGGGFRPPEEPILRLAAAGLLAVATGLVALDGRRALGVALLTVGALALALARAGSADVIVGLAALAAGAIALAAHQLGEPAEAQNDDLAIDETQPDERQLLERMGRELQGTIGELIVARRTIALQRAELDRVTTLDELTGLASRPAILERLRFETAEARRYDHPLAVLLLDIDGLAEVNREHGLATGDAVLREVALRLRLRVRDADAVGRASGDGFLLILPHTDERGAAVFSDTLRRRIGHRETLTDAGALTVSVSIGVAIVRPGTRLSDEDVLANAAEALASAKAAGGDRIAFDRAHGLARLEGRRERPHPDASTAQDSGS